jgi:tRNA dimethylallyltransferase
MSGRSGLKPPGTNEGIMVKSETIFIVGPTASGKSELALRVAEKIGAEICSIDAFQVYRGLDIGTGKLTTAQMRGIPHHLMDRVNPLQTFSVADYLQLAEGIISDLMRREKPMVWVGGTGLYYRALRHGLSPVPSSDPALIQELSSWSLPHLQEEILKCDPIWCQTADLNNPRRIIRALAVVRQTGQPLSRWHQVQGNGLLETGEAYFLQPETAWLKAKVEERIDGMWQAGWKREVQELLTNPVWKQSQSFRAIGYSQVASHLEGAMTEGACLQEIRIKTWQFARRQLTWFRSEANLTLLDSSDINQALSRIIDKRGKSQLSL